MAKRSVKLPAGAVLAALCLVAGNAPAQQRGFALDRFDPSERGSEWFVLDSLDLRGHRRVAAGVIGAWGRDPLVAYDAGGNQVASLVAHQVTLHPGASLALLDRLRVGFDLPLAVHQTGDTVRAGTTTYRPPESAFGDLRLSGDVRVLGRHRGPVTAAAGISVYLPTGSRDDFTSDGYVRIAPRLTVAGDIARFTYAARLGFAYRALDERFEQSPLGSELTFGAAAGLRFASGHVVVGPELFGSSIVDPDAFLERRGTPLEWLFGAHATAGDVRFGAGLGRGITRGWGTPSLRALLSAEWTPGESVPRPPLAAPPPAPPPRAEPMPDRPVPVPPIVPDADPDGDGDGIADRDDACPDTPGARSDDPTASGCPSDRDGDGVADDEDTCPDAPGPADLDARRNGCPLARIAEGEIKIVEQLHFRTDSAEILRDSDTTLLAVATLLEAHPEIAKLRIEGHSDDRGKYDHNRELSFRRANAVRKWLVSYGLDARRFEAKGFGPVRPVAPNETEDGRERNRRVELHVALVHSPPPKP